MGFLSKLWKSIEQHEKNGWPDVRGAVRAPVRSSSATQVVRQPRFGNKPYGELDRRTGQDNPNLQYMGLGAFREQAPAYLRNVLDNALGGWQPHTLSDIRLPEAPSGALSHAATHYTKPQARALHEFAQRLKHLDQTGTLDMGQKFGNQWERHLPNPTGPGLGTHGKHFGYDNRNFLANQSYARKEADQFQQKLQKELERLRNTPMALPQFVPAQAQKPLEFNFHEGGQVKNKHWTPGSKEPMYVSDHGHGPKGEILIQGHDQIVPDAMHDRYGNLTTKYNKLRDPSNPWVAPSGGNPDSPYVNGSAASANSVGRNPYDTPTPRPMGHADREYMGWGKRPFEFNPGMSSANGTGPGSSTDPFGLQHGYFSFVRSLSDGLNNWGKYDSASQANMLEQLSYMSSIQPHQFDPKSANLRQDGSFGANQSAYQGLTQGMNQQVQPNPYGPGSFTQSPWGQNPFASAYGAHLRQGQQNSPASPQMTPNFQSVFANQQPPSNHTAHSNQVSPRPNEPWMRRPMTGGAGAGMSPTPMAGKSLFS